jgi:hypothetical protein
MKRVALTVAILLSALSAAHAQTPKPKPSTGGRGAATKTETSDSAKRPYDGPATLLFRIDMACRIWIDGVLALTAAEGDVKPIKVSLGDHLMKVETIDGLASWQRAINVPRADQQLVATELAARWWEASDVRDAAWLQTAVTGVVVWIRDTDSVKFRESFILELQDCHLILRDDWALVSSDPEHAKFSAQIDLSLLGVDEVILGKRFAHDDSGAPSPVYNLTIGPSRAVAATENGRRKDNDFYIRVAGEARAKSVWATIRKLARDCHEQIPR